MKRIIFLMAAALSLVACNQNTPDDTKKGGDDTTSQHQPANPDTWSPVGHKYVSTDKDFPDREITFLSKDSFLWKREEHERVYPYSIEYPTIYVWEEKHAWLKFTDTLNISRKSDLADESSRYELVY